ncbi:restriction endonuclease subunit S [uncultured Amphritea sp.]|uniref:restriction endonuclease subunit S n=1 Tax=uncultured Amphritea sp. TaxID=981605 RepID=UPI0025E2FAFE|nr:restriction endonuclease subunit S [uncultured Amphritea sp.]
METLKSQATAAENPADLITNNIDIWTSALKTRSSAGRGSSKKLDLYGIKKLRELILELAVRGKLVPQDPNDEPASVLLERIAGEKAQRVKEGKIKPAKVLPEVLRSDKSFELPEGWEWVRFGSICEIERGGSPRPIKSFLTDEPDGLNWIKIGDTEIGGKYITSTNEKIRKEGLKKTRKVYPGDFLLTNSMSFGRPYITKIEGCIHDGWLRISPPDSLDKDYLYNLLSSPYVMRSFKSAAAGAVVMNLNADKVRVVCILLPPLEEQHRIVAKVDELMALCDQLEQQTEASIDAHATLVETLLTTLTNSADAAELEQNWNRIAAHFDTLFTTEHSIDQLKQTVLQLAVMGKLVPQDPNDEPAAVLLDKIAAEKAQLVKEKKIKKQKPLPPIAEDEKPFALPEGWEWVRFDDIAKNEKNALKAGPFGSALKKTMYTQSGYKIYGQEQVISGDENLGDYFIDEAKYLSLESCKVQPGDILISLVGTIGKVLILSENSLPGIINPRLVKLNLDRSIVREYIRIVLGSKLIRDELFDKSHGSTMNVLNLGLLRGLLFPIPAIEEQHRIVTKVDQLMTLCDQLKLRLQQTQQTQLHLADALVEQAVG